MTKMTERQARDWSSAVKEAQQHVDTSTIPTDIGHWKAVWADEVRPGRGHSVDATWCDGEYLVQIMMDVYGSPSVSVASLEWLHNSSDEECQCEPCAVERHS